MVGKEINGFSKPGKTALADSDLQTLERLIAKSDRRGAYECGDLLRLAGAVPRLIAELRRERREPKLPL